MLASVAVEPCLISVKNLNADFTSLLVNVCNILSNPRNEQKNLEICKDFCVMLLISDGSNQPMFNAEKIRECRNFKQLFEIIRMDMSWDEHSILTQIVDHCNSAKGKEEINKFEKKMALYQGLQIISSDSSRPEQNLSEDFVKFCAIIDKPYKNVTINEYKDIKHYICSNLKVRTCVIAGFIKMLYHSLHIEWLVSVQAVPHMINNAYQNKDVLIKENFVFMQIGIEVVINDEV